MILHQNKYHLIVNKLNFLGFETEQQTFVQIRDILYVGEVKNEYLSFDYTGLPPSISKIISLSNTYLEKDDKGNVISDSVKAEDKDTYKHFLAFMAKDVNYLIPVDGNNFKESVIAEELLNHIVHGRQRAVLNFNYSKLEEENERLDENFQEFLEMHDDQHQEADFVTRNTLKRRAYSYYHPNRDYGDHLEHLQVKKVDNEEFWDNGYR